MTLLEKLKQDLELAEKATPGPWEVCNGDGAILTAYIVPPQNLKREIPIGYPGKIENSDFVAASRTHWPATTRALIKAIEALQFCARPTLSRKATEEIHRLSEAACKAIDEIEKELE